MQVVRQEAGVIRIPIREITGKSEPAYRLWFILQDFDFQHNQMRNIMASLDGIAGKQFFSSRHVLLVDRDYIILKALSETPDSRELVIAQPDITVDW